MAVSTVLLWLPVARAGEGGAPLLVALFTATSAVCVTGLTVVDTPTYWSGFGEAVIMLSIQVGGFGIMTLASLLALVVSRRLGLRTRLAAQSETKALGLGDIRRVLLGVAGFSLVFEVASAILLTGRLAAAYDEPFGTALYHGAFHAVSAFNNAGFVLYSDNLIGFAADPVVCLTIAAAVILGGLGFPVLFELWREARTPRTWSLHTRIVLWMTAVLLVVGGVAFTALEWSNPDTLGPMSVGAKLLAGFFMGVQPRSSGFNSIDVSAMEPSTWFLTDVLMFIGGAPAGTAGGVKVTTVALLAFVVVAEMRGDPSVSIWRRRLPEPAQRQAVSVVLVGAVIVIASTVALLLIGGGTLDRVLFESVSAFATVGLSTGITADLPAGGQLLLTALMFIGRIGPLTLGAALALRSRPILYRLPEERPIIG